MRVEQPYAQRVLLERSFLVQVAFATDVVGAIVRDMVSLFLCDFYSVGGRWLIFTKDKFHDYAAGDA